MGALRALTFAESHWLRKKNASRVPRRGCVAVTREEKEKAPSIGESASSSLNCEFLSQSEDVLRARTARTGVVGQEASRVRAVRIQTRGGRVTLVVRVAHVIAPAALLA